MRKFFLKDVLSLMTVIMLIVLVLFPAIEPGFADAASTAQVVVSQEVTSEMAITVTSGTVTMLPSIPGITGGVGTGTTTVNVLTNNSTGYTVALSALNSGKMMGDTMGGEILAYAQDTTPETWSVPANTARFGYTITANAGDVVAGSVFTGGLADGTKYISAATSHNILKSATSTIAAGADASLSFRAQITANPSPAIPEDWYVATTTLTMSMN